MPFLSIHLIIHNHRRSHFNIPENGRTCIIRCIDTSMGTGIQIFRAAVNGTPQGVMNTHAADDLHPEVYRRPVIFTDKNRILLTAVYKINPRRRTVTRTHRSRSDRRRYKNFPVFVKPHILAG